MMAWFPSFFAFTSFVSSCHAHLPSLLPSLVPSLLPPPSIYACILSITRPSPPSFPPSLPSLSPSEGSLLILVLQ